MVVRLTGSFFLSYNIYIYTIKGNSFEALENVKLDLA
jgi:hypothetical protein